MSEENNDLKSKLVSGLKIDALRQISRLMSEYISSVELFDLESLIEDEVEKRVQERLEKELKLERERIHEEVNKLFDMGDRSVTPVETAPMASVSETPMVDNSENRELTDYINEALDAPSGGMEEASDRVIDKPVLNGAPDLSGGLTPSSDVVIDKPVLGEELPSEGLVDADGMRL